MGDDWMKREKLSEFVIELESGTRPKGGVSVESGTIPSLGAEHLNNTGGFNFHKNKYTSKDFFHGMKTGIIKKNDILIVKDGATTGKISYVNKDFTYKKASKSIRLYCRKSRNNQSQISG